VRNLYKSLRQDERGTTLLEFAIVGPLFIALTVGTIYLSMCLFMVGSMHYAVEEGARCASVRKTVCTDATTTISYAKSQYFGPSSPVFTYDPAASCGKSVSASITYILELGLTQIPVPIAATGCFPA